MPVIVISGARQMQGPVGIGTSPVAEVPAAVATALRVYNGERYVYMRHDGSNGKIGQGGGGDLYIGDATADRWYFKNLSGHFLAVSDNLYDIGTPTAFRPRNVYLTGRYVSDVGDQINAGNGAYWERSSASEEVTIAAAASTLSTANLLPANSIIEAVCVRVTVALPDPTASFQVGINGGSATAYGTGILKALDTVNVGLSNATNVAAAKVIITPNANPGAATGKVRVVVFYRRFVPPTS